MDLPQEGSGVVKAASKALDFIRIFPCECSSNQGRRAVNILYVEFPLFYRCLFFACSSKERVTAIASLPLGVFN